MPRAMLRTMGSSLRGSSLWADAWISTSSVPLGDSRSKGSSVSGGHVKSREKQGEGHAG